MLFREELTVKIFFEIRSDDSARAKEITTVCWPRRTAVCYSGLSGETTDPCVTRLSRDSRLLSVSPSGPRSLAASELGTD